MSANKLCAKAECVKSDSRFVVVRETLQFSAQIDRRFARRPSICTQLKNHFWKAFFSPWGNTNSPLPLACYLSVKVEVDKAAIFARNALVCSESILGGLRLFGHYRERTLTASES